MGYPKNFIFLNPRRAGERDEPPATNGGAQAQRGEVTCPMTHSTGVMCSQVCPAPKPVYFDYPEPSWKEWLKQGNGCDDLS